MVMPKPSLASHLSSEHLHEMATLCRDLHRLLGLHVLLRKEKARVNSEFTTVYLKGGIIFTPCFPTGRNHIRGTVERENRRDARRRDGAMSANHAPVRVVFLQDFVAFPILRWTQMSQKSLSKVWKSSKTVNSV